MPYTLPDDNLKKAGAPNNELTARRGAIRWAAPQISAATVARYMGMPDDAKPGSSVEKAVLGAIALAEPLIRPVALWALPEIQAVKREHITVAFPQADPIQVPANGRLFKGATSVLCLVLTLGSAIDQLLGELFNSDDLLLALAVDASAAAVIATAGHNLREGRAAALKQVGLQTGAYYSPGCQALPLTAQKALFAILQPEQIGMKLAESCLMSPAKSVTNVAPVAAALPEWMLQLDPCRLCNMGATCTYKAARG